jgi:hypothetical protein
MCGLGRIVFLFTTSNLPPDGNMSVPTYKIPTLAVDLLAPTTVFGDLSAWISSIQHPLQLPHLTCHILHLQLL